MCSFSLSIAKILFIALVIFNGCTCLCDDPQPEPYYISYLFRDSSNQNILEEKIGEKVKLYFLDENGNKELAQIWEINEAEAKSGQVDYFYTSQCEEYQQFFEIEISGNTIQGNFKASPFYEKKSCCSKYCNTRIIYYQEMQS